VLLKDAIHIPTSVRQGDLVYKLTDASEHTKETVEQYVVTPQLEASFIDAVQLVKAAVTEQTSKAAYLSGSFGSGKSNFMGVLQLLLDGNAHALAKPELAPVVAKLADWRDGQKFLTVPYHLIGATSFDSAVLGGYVDHIRELHPDAPLPEVFADEPILATADRLRSSMGDDAFFKGLGGAAAGGSGWGELEGGWDAARYDAARARPAGDPERRLLLQAVLDGYLEGMADIARANRGGYVDIDSGLEAISRHAKGLGYTGLILFLDELILWLMGRMADPAFVSEESSKISKLVEGSDDNRPVPIISIIARQRDLRELIGTDVPGLDRMGFIDNLKFQSGRFSNIRLDDSNLPRVAHERLLKPTSDDGAAALQHAFGSLALTDDQRDALRGASGSDDEFALTYPFSPAFLTVVVDVAGALQRTRTGLRVLLDLLVENRETIEVGQLVPLGDLFDVLATSDEPLSDAMKDTFDSALTLYRTALRPMLLADHGLGPDDEPTAAFRTDDRLAKTLLLAALVPNSEPFRNLTARKLLALNHGLLAAPVPGAEVAVVINKLNNWATRPIGLQVSGDPQNPSVHLVLSELNLGAILDGIAGVDNTGARRKLIKDLISEELGLPVDQLMQSTTVSWRGLPRTVDLVFGNVRDTAELADSAFASSGANWKVVIDFPFDDEGVDPRADVARVESLRDRGNEWHTVCWIPSFLTADLRGQVGDLVRLNHLIPVPGQMSDRLREATQHLSPEARESARPQLEAMQKATRERLRQALKQAYGITNPDPSVVDTTFGLADHFPTLVSGLTIQPPVAADLRAAFEGMVSQALVHVYPGAPEMDGDIRRADLTTVLRICEEAVQQPGMRIAQVPAADRKVMSRIANPLRLGVQSEQAFTLEGAAGHWDAHFTREIGKWRDAGGEGNPTVGELRRWIDQPRAMGLSTEVQNLVLLVWAESTDRAFTEHGGPARTELGTLGDHLEVVDVELPSDAEWAEARTRAEHVLGVAGLPDEPSAVGLSRLSSALATATSEYAEDADLAVARLESLDALLSTSDDPARLRTARSAAALMRSLSGTAGDLDRVRAFTTADLTPSAPAVGASLKASKAVIAAVTSIDADILGAAAQRPEGTTVVAGLTDLMDSDELATKFAPRLAELYAAARSLVIPGPGPTPPSPQLIGGDDDRVAVPIVTPQPAGTGKVILEASELDRESALKRLKELRDRLKQGEHEGSTFTIRVTAEHSDGDAG
jgi:hypothetical protein